MSKLLEKLDKIYEWVDRNLTLLLYGNLCLKLNFGADITKYNEIYNTGTHSVRCLGKGYFVILIK